VQAFGSSRQEFINPMDVLRNMEGEGPESADLEYFCQAVSPNDEPCHHPATVGCTRCGRWFCDTHVEDEEWHSCALPSGEEGGEA